MIEFENAFMDIQASLVSLCLEFVDNNVDKIYIFIYQDCEMQTFNTFFRKDGKVKITTDFSSDELTDKFLDMGIQEIDNLINICDKYNQKCPNEIKMIYDVKNKSFDATYCYQDYAKTGEKDPDDTLINWLKEEKSK